MTIFAIDFGPNIGSQRLDPQPHGSRSTYPPDDGHIVKFRYFPPNLQGVLYLTRAEIDHLKPAHRGEPPRGEPGVEFQSAEPIFFPRPRKPDNGEITREGQAASISRAKGNWLELSRSKVDVPQLSSSRVEEP
jgi:hypothetical protein